MERERWLGLNKEEKNPLALALLCSGCCSGTQGVAARGQFCCPLGVLTQTDVHRTQAGWQRQTGKRSLPTPLTQLTSCITTDQRGRKKRMREQTTWMTLRHCAQIIQHLASLFTLSVPNEARNFSRMLLLLTEVEPRMGNLSSWGHLSASSLASKGLSRCTEPLVGCSTPCPQGPCVALSLGLILPDYRRPGRRTPCNTGHSTSAPRGNLTSVGRTESFFSREQARIKEVTVKLFAEGCVYFKASPPDTPYLCLPQLERVVKCQLTKLLSEQ